MSFPQKTFENGAQNSFDESIVKGRNRMERQHDGRTDGGRHISENPCDIHVKHLEFCEFCAYFARMGSFIPSLCDALFGVCTVYTVHTKYKNSTTALCAP